MMQIAETPTAHSITCNRRVTLGLILALLMLRYLVTGFRLVFAEPPGWVIPVFEIGTYLLVAILLVRESQSLPDYHINTLSLWIVIIFKPIETIYLLIVPKQNYRATFPMEFPSISSLFVWAIALGLLIYFRAQLFQKRAVRWREMKWMFLGCLIGLGTVLVTSYPVSFTISSSEISRWTISSLLISNSATFLSILYQIGYAAISEEPVFRGFLWGYLRRLGWRDVWIWLFQAVLFVLAHFHYTRTSPIIFWLITPISGLVLGWLVWRSRSLASSMVAHGVINGLSNMMNVLLAVLRS